MAVKIDVDDAGNETVAVREAKQSHRKLNIAAWLAAWDRYALALTIVGVLDFNHAMRYKQACIRCGQCCVYPWPNVCR